MTCQANDIHNASDALENALVKRLTEQRDEANAALQVGALGLDLRV